MQLADLEEIDDLEGYIKRSACVLVYCSKGYFTSMNCMRELVASADMQKSIIALVDPESSHGGLNFDEILQMMQDADRLALSEWHFKSQPMSEKHTSEWHRNYVWPGSQFLYDSLLANDAIEWNRIGHFQDVCALSI